jgi:hypothetical protein
MGRSYRRNAAASKAWFVWDQPSLQGCYAASSSGLTHRRGSATRECEESETVAFCPGKRQSLNSSPSPGLGRHTARRCALSLDVHGIWSASVLLLGHRVTAT